jgi:acetolactate synthase regulatory subunit
MKTYQIKILANQDEPTVLEVLTVLAKKGIIAFSESTSELQDNKRTEASADQVQEIIEESELGPYYSEKEAKDILNL